MGKFIRGMVIYALVFLILAGAGLAFLWDYMDYFEKFQVDHAIVGYLDTLTGEQVWKHAGDFSAKLDLQLEEEEDCLALVSDILSQEITYARDPQKSSEEAKHYVVFSGGDVIGEIALTQGEETRYGFRPWQVTAESYDFSHLLDGAFSLTVPPEYTVLVNGKALPNHYITQRDIPYETLEGFYEDYALPTMVRYTAGPFLLEPQVQVLDGAGYPADVSDENAFLDNCTEEEIAQLEIFADAFVHRYVRYTGSANHNQRDDYLLLMYYVVYGSELGTRLYDAMYGLSFAQSRGDEVVSIQLNQYSNIGEGRYFLDLTYVVNTLGHAGLVQTTSNCKLIVAQTTYGLKAENLISY